MLLLKIFIVLVLAFIVGNLIMKYRQEILCILLVFISIILIPFLLPLAIMCDIIILPIISPEKYYNEKLNKEYDNIFCKTIASQLKRKRKKIAKIEINLEKIRQKTKEKNAKKVLNEYKWLI